MKNKHRKHVHGMLYYAPRVFAIIVGLFFMMMLFDLPSGFGTMDFLRAFLPGFIVILAMALTWNRPRRASLIFAALTLIYTAVAWPMMPDSVIGVVTVPLIIVSALLILNAKSHLFA